MLASCRAEMIYNRAKMREVETRKASDAAQWRRASAVRCKPHCCGLGATQDLAREGSRSAAKAAPATHWAAMAARHRWVKEDTVYERRTSAIDAQTDPSTRAVEYFQFSNNFPLV